MGVKLITSCLEDVSPHPFLFLYFCRLMMKNKDLLYKATLFEAGSELQKIRNIVNDGKAKKLRKIFFAQVDYAKKLRLFKKYEKDLKKADKSFIKFVKLLNKSSVYKGHKNFIEEISEKSEVPKDSLKDFVKDSYRVISFINRRVEFKKDTPREYWSEFYLPFPVHRSQKKYEIDEIYSVWRNVDPKAQEIISKIRIRRVGREASCVYDDRKDLFEIRCNLVKRTIPEIFTFVHELGHAKHESELLKIGSQAGRYHKEKNAYEFALRLMKEIAPEDEFWAYLWFKTKELLVNGLFEYFIYTKQDANPAKLYAELHNRFHRKKVQRENYYYLTVNYLLFENGRFFTAAVPFVEAFKEVIIKDDS